MRTSAFRSPKPTSAAWSEAMSRARPKISSRSHRRMSRATWSFRERAVWSLAPAGTRRGRPLLFLHVTASPLPPPLEPAGGDLLADLIEPLDDGSVFAAVEQADFLKHGCVGDGTQDVLPPQPAVERDRFGVLRDVGPRSAVKPPAAGDERP